MRKRHSAFVSAAEPPRSWLSRLLSFLFPPTLRRPSTKTIQAPPIYTETPPHVFLLRQRGTEARQLLNRYIEGHPVSRRAWVAAGHKELAWRRARRILISARILNRDGTLNYRGRDALTRLETHLDRYEYECYRRGVFVPPW